MSYDWVTINTWMRDADDDNTKKVKQKRLNVRQCRLLTKELSSMLHNTNGRTLSLTFFASCEENKSCSSGNANAKISGSRKTPTPTSSHFHVIFNLQMFTIDLITCWSSITSRRKKIEKLSAKWQPHKLLPRNADLHLDYRFQGDVWNDGVKFESKWRL